MGGDLGSRGDVRHGAARNPAVFAGLLTAALWLAIAGLVAAWWSGGAGGWRTLWPAGMAAGLALAALAG